MQVTRLLLQASKKMASDANCIFCKIVKGEIPCYKLVETEKTLAFLDIQPLSRGHALVIPKHHGEKLTDIPDDSLTELLPIAKKLALASGAANYNILQNNGKLAHQEVGPRARAHDPQAEREGRAGCGLAADGDGS
ncbi:unnamed protein product [Sordaria macrospora k-hell]|uniref:WGS project CABT00000000 data, contig 2.24 n=1 Tax=Sordaria macrospora (strain ATCC MYA-333 / DSM 997 / K(L3346) / K-hell) TaxID=771870 RepID=F7W3H2_SORMK|nr:uncharacterized protein SMAC_05912 [Sordaria macrospora k-hell]CCC12174.1 unnamed protein product [Sordaria macrospora k-hell]